ncbi:MFS transporter [Spirillospora sp. NPDC029432]|uniref:MFS transporter n=1 Tax=Spirillospora sp. NPDC029432 TaxID=3154599 RepID=UPI003453954C
MIVAAPASASAPASGPAPPGAGDRRVIVTMVAVQFATCVGFFGVMAHLVAHLRHDLHLLAGTVGLIMGVRLGVQYVLLLPVGAVTDLLGPRRTGVLACALRAPGFVLLGTATETGPLLAAAVVIGAGGALYNPAAQSLLAGVSPERRAAGFAAYVATQHIGTIAGPLVGLGLLATGPGFPMVTGAAGATWVVAGVLFLLMPRGTRQAAPPRPRDVLTGVRAVLRDRRFLLFAVMTAPTTLLANHIMTAVPNLGFASGVATLSFSAMAAVAAAAQPFVAAGGRGEHPWVLRAGLLCAAAAFLVLAPLDGTENGPLVLAALLNGVANGLVQPSIFQRAARHAPPGRFGSYYGVLASFAGLFACAGDLVIGRLFDLGPAGAAGALTGVAAFALVAAFGTRGP